MSDSQHKLAYVKCACGRADAKAGTLPTLRRFYDRLLAEGWTFTTYGDRCPGCPPPTDYEDSLNPHTAPSPLIPDANEL